MAKQPLAKAGKAFEAISVASGMIFAQPMEPQRSRQRSQSTAPQRMSDRAFESRPQKAAQRNLREAAKKSLFATCFWLAACHSGPSVLHWHKGPYERQSPAGA